MCLTGQYVSKCQQKSDRQWSVSTQTFDAQLRLLLDNALANMVDELVDLPLFKSTLTSIAQSASSCHGLLSSLNVDTELSYPNGISLLSLKNSLLLSYMHRLTLLTMAKLQGRSLQSDEQVRKLLVEELVRERVMLEKIRPLEAKLRYQVDKLVTKADNADKQDAERAAGIAVDDDDIANGTVCKLENQNFANITLRS